MPQTVTNDDMSLKLQKMVFIYNALLSGWTVSMIDNDKFEFTKDHDESTKREVDLADYLRKFIQYNLNIDNLNST